MALNSSRVAEKPVSLLWGCELSEQKKTAAFKVDVEEYEQQALRTRPGSTSTSKYDHRLVLNTVCMGEKAKDEFHIIEIVPKDEEGKDSKPVPIACLKPSILPMATLVGLEMMPPITFRLKSGAGPVYVSGQHIAMETECWVEEEEEELEEEEVEEEEEISPVKPNKRPAAQKKTGPAKVQQLKKKMEDDFDNGMDSEEDVKGKPAVKGRKPAVKK